VPWKWALIITTIGFDIAKSVFQVHGVDAEGNLQLKRRYMPAFLRKAAAVLPGREPSWRLSQIHKRSVVVVIIIVAPVSSSSDASIVTIIGLCLTNRHHDA
jgi:transposase